MAVGAHRGRRVRLHHLPVGHRGRDNHIYLAHKLGERPSFDQVLTVRLVRSTVRTPVGHPLDDDLSALRLDQAQHVSFSRDTGVEHRLSAGEVVTASFPATTSPASSRSATNGVIAETLGQVVAVVA